MSRTDPIDVDAAAEALYGLPPAEFVAARDEWVAAAREDGDRRAARAIGRLRRPTQAAWLANLLARDRAEQLEGLLGIAESLSEAQRSLDGAALRTLSAQRHKIVAAMAREARRLARQRGHSVTEATERDLRGILEAALADPGIAAEVRSGRLTRTVSYSGFGPEIEPDAAPRPADRPSPITPVRGRAGAAAEPADEADRAEDEQAEDERAERERAERERAERERAERERRACEIAAAERDLEQALEAAAEAEQQLEADRAESADAEREHALARSRVDELAAALEHARVEERAAAETKRAAADAERESARAARTAATALSFARTRLRNLSEA
ncbi:hypothetical protein ACVGVM_13770 [Pseudonocardia bannensis]|uniref:Uncharacterized protein n=1 Tax=Pseudonocardia bannensis TaxID=630973 RepID=A0A848DNL5_9PSEU|nr:hypothetical protein [Pseudonocardia bannensis]NMH94076.1 hypothetical protein [Pseudonocardia bannensis]